MITIMNVGNAIKAFRKRKGLSQKDLAQVCGLSANAMCSIENNESFPSRESLEKISAALGIPTSYLMFFAVTDEDVPEEKRVVFNAMKAILMG